MHIHNSLLSCSSFLFLGMSFASPLQGASVTTALVQLENRGSPTTKAAGTVAESRYPWATSMSGYSALPMSFVSAEQAYLEKVWATELAHLRSPEYASSYKALGWAGQMPIPLTGTADPTGYLSYATASLAPSAYPGLTNQYIDDVEVFSNSSTSVNATTNQCSPDYRVLFFADNLFAIKGNTWQDGSYYDKAVALQDSINKKCGSIEEWYFAKIDPPQGDLTWEVTGVGGTPDCIEGQIQAYKTPSCSSSKIKIRSNRQM